MAIVDGCWNYKDVQVLMMIDPKRYRATILGRSPRHPEIYSVKLKRLHDKDRRRILRRAQEWIDKYAAGRRE